jgi:hypothetical protein
MFSYTQWLDELIKAAGHKYIKRIPYQSGGKMRYRYIYNVTHTHQGKHVLDLDHMKVGTKLMLDATSGAEVHGHIQSVSGDKVTFFYDDGPKKGKSVTMSKEKLASELDKVHGISSKLDAARKKEQKKLDIARRSGASSKVLAKIEARIERLKQDIKRDTPSELQKSIIRDHTVTSDRVARHKARIEKNLRDPMANPTSQPAHLMVRRIDALTRDGAEEAVTKYNKMITQSAKENQDVLKAIEAYKDIIAVRLDTPETLNQIMRTVADNLDGLTTTYGLTADMTAEDIEATLGEARYRDFQRDVFARTGYSFEKGTGVTVEKVCSLGVDKHVQDMEQSRKSSEIAKRARQAVQEHIAKACAEFSFEHMAHKEGKFHPNHKRDTKKRTSRQQNIFKRTAHVLAHVEDIFQRAYPERKGEQTFVTIAQGDRAFADLNDANAHTIALANTDAKIAAHELAHTLENNRSNRATYQQGIQAAVTLTHLTRTTHEGEVYHEGEYALTDKYHDKYAGKLYSDGTSELVTMGVQEFFKYKTRGYDNEAGKAVDLDPSEGQMKNIADFAITDPHHYLVTYGILKGYTK